MPLSADQDTHNTSSGNPNPTKVTQKGSSAGAQVLPKNGRKNGTAKESSGGSVLAAVAKNSKL